MSANLAPLLNAVSDDPEIKALAKQLALDAIAQARYLLFNGAPEVRARMVATLLPVTMASMKQQPEDQDGIAMRVQMMELLAEVKGT
jgi:hypothetical protein